MIRVFDTYIVTEMKRVGVEEGTNKEFRVDADFVHLLGLRLACPFQRAGEDGSELVASEYNLMHRHLLSKKDSRHKFIIFGHSSFFRTSKYWFS